MNQSPHFTKDRFAWIILNYVLLNALDVTTYLVYNLGKVQISLSKIISSGSISIKSQGCECHLGLWAMPLGCEIIPDMLSKCIIQRFKTVSLCKWSALKFSTRGRGRSIIGGGAHIHIFVLCIINFF